ncbi:MAG: 4-hydroxy-3-methylbut-2-enyl diphosphate reductase [candidate division WS2 bacterium]|uniref:4-hydroxy-3-methylbut-2-enyl diphosphate reductase n=1 Tax=Psychracetigena formicireducens TaxID=2986056 RepID=A0A9E2F1U3_PSYF1|nr:4-hydroxy-3-methylbut-2-enyl diphosphate reductase [Candidatus Psychracetigena formicireducens]MBT9145032.1 4-hydroxy-3-methylbut-2-enyl diphosphate reductase [Candidatus Psychracetigena formicireducens]MBT9150652.1 4-hydroxy-3-methylbut-2-enyl diphosphate reductase [Candidatus Psychracetigena formicireducens]
MVYKIKLVKAKKLGYCKGVEKAIKEAEVTLDSEKENKVYLWNDLTHNVRAKEMLQDRGLLKYNQEAEKGSLLLGPAHGLPKQVKNHLINQGLSVKELTCPIVVRLLESCLQLINQGYFLLILGDKEHSEIKYVTSYLPEGKYQVFLNPAEVKKLPARIALVEQTTQSLVDVQKALGHISLMSDVKELLYRNTLCQEMVERQKEGLELAEKVDAVIVLGDKKSANTRRLFELVSSVNFRVFLVSHFQELDGLPLHTFSSIALLSGASTPMEVIKEVEDYLNAYT